MPTIRESRASTEAQAVAQLALTGALPAQVAPGELWQLVDADGNKTIVSTERWAPNPYRPQGTIQVHNAEGFLAAFAARWPKPADAPTYPQTAAVNAYSDEDKMALVAVLNDDTPDGTAGWRDYRVSLELRRTPEWTMWVDGQGLGDRSRFADIIEKGEKELRDPAPAVMLELAQTFHTTTDARFTAGSRLQSGARQFRFEESQTAKAGTDGTIEVPEVFTIAVRPFFGGQLYEVTAKLKWRQRGGEFAIGYDLIRSGDVERMAFGQIVDTVEGGLATAGHQVPFIAGPAPAYRRVE